MASSLPQLEQLREWAAALHPTPLPVNLSHLGRGDRAALVKLLEAGYLIDKLFRRQLWSGNTAVYERLKQDRTEFGQAQLHLFRVYAGPWSTLHDGQPFVSDVPERKPPGCHYYPDDMTAEEFERWVAQLSPQEAEQAKSFVTVIRRNEQDGRLKVVPYREEYKDLLAQAAQRLREAAALTDNDSLRRFLAARAAAFLTDDYYESDVAWMDVDAPIEVTIGPYETYSDELFGYKAAFEAYICIQDNAETAKLRDFCNHLQEVENSLPLDDKYKNPQLGATTPIRVVNQILSAGDGNHGVQAAAFNLPNDERVILQKGSKKVMLKNVQHAKFERVLKPISEYVLAPEAQKDVRFDAFFTHILAHELSHGIGPQTTVIDGRRISVRAALKDAYSPLEEAKADITALFMLQFFFERGLLQGGEEVERQLYNTFLASAFRTLRFGISEAHGLGMAVQMTYLAQHGAISCRPDGRFEVNRLSMKSAVHHLTRELLMIEAEGDYLRAKSMLQDLGKVSPEVQAALARLASIPIDIEPIFVTANELAPRPS